MRAAGPGRAPAGAPGPAGPPPYPRPGAVMLMALGCAGDANPSPRTGIELARQHGQAICTAVDRVLTNALSPVQGKLACRTRRIELPMDRLPTRAEWEARAKDTNYIGAHARMNLARLTPQPQGLTADKRG